MGESVHFVGVGGSGMSALAQFHAMGGGKATGSDRFLDRGDIREVREKLEALGVELFPQDGSGVKDGTRRLVVSTAIEKDNPDLSRAAALKLPVVHRADELAAHVAAMKTIAVAGTSGKSTVTGMVFEILCAAGLEPSVITGGNLPALRRQGLLGNALRGASDLLVIEADESDGTLPKYKPWLGLLLNLGKDHKELSELREIFRGFRKNSANLVVNADAAGLAEFQPGAATFGFDAGELRAERLVLGPAGSSFLLKGVEFRVPMPGRYNAENALAAVAACLPAGVRLEDAARGIAGFQGVARRFERLGSARGVEVIDDFAHNPDKVRAAIAAAHLRAKRVLAVFQPHGFAPTRFLKDDFIEAFVAALQPDDSLWLPEIYYAGGTAAKNISSRDIAEPVAARGRRAFYVERRDDAIPDILRSARKDDVILVMGARDPSLGAFAQSILEALKNK